MSKRDIATVRATGAAPWTKRMARPVTRVLAAPRRVLYLPEGKAKTDRCRLRFGRRGRSYAEPGPDDAAPVLGTPYAESPP